MLHHDGRELTVVGDREVRGITVGARREIVVHGLRSHRRMIVTTTTTERKGRKGRRSEGRGVVRALVLVGAAGAVDVFACDRLYGVRLIVLVLPFILTALLTALLSFGWRRDPLAPPYTEFDGLFLELEHGRETSGLNQLIHIARRQLTELVERHQLEQRHITLNTSNEDRAVEQTV
jgi:hypothetical protein